MLNGLIKDLPNEDYHANDTHYSSSRLKDALKSTRHFAKYKPMGYKDYFAIGTAFETLLIEKEKFFDEVVVFDERLRPNKNFTLAAKENKAWKENFWIENKGKTIITPKDYEMIKEMVDECDKNPVIQGLIESGDFQISVFWEDENGLKVKTRPDIVIWTGEKTCVIIDIKSTVSASPSEFSKQAQNLNYPFQAIMQIKGLESLGYFVDSYYWLACEKNIDIPLAQLYEFTFEQQTPMRIAYDSVSKNVKKWKETNKASGYEIGCGNDYGIQTLGLSDWYLNNMKNV